MMKFLNISEICIDAKQIISLNGFSLKQKWRCRKKQIKIEDFPKREWGC